MDKNQKVAAAFQNISSFTVSKKMRQLDDVFLVCAQPCFTLDLAVLGSFFRIGKAKDTRRFLRSKYLQEPPSL